MSLPPTPYRSDVIQIGNVLLGGDNPVRLQSMTNTDTLDTKASIAQCIRIIRAGADFVRLTAQGIKEAENLAKIKEGLRKAGFETPLIADIHFNPAAAETAAAIVEKVRINPGNYADKRASFLKTDLSEIEYLGEIERIHTRLLPLINICNRNRTAIRIGVNHGSLSDRIMTRYGNTPQGMAMSAIEFIRIFHAENFNSLVLSMKSSDIAVMIDSVRIVVRMMEDEGFAYPIHLGVTEAGEGEDGRIRSAAGIGALLSEGIGDTIRVSLSEDPENEIPVAKRIVKYFPRTIPETRLSGDLIFKTPADKPGILSKIHGPLVIANMTHYSVLDQLAYRDAGYAIDETTGKVVKTDEAADLIITRACPDLIPDNVMFAVPFRIWLQNMQRENLFPLFSPETWSDSAIRSEKLNLILTGPHYNKALLSSLDPLTSLLIFTFDPARERYSPERFFSSLSESGLQLNVILNPVFAENDPEELMVKSSAILGVYLTDRRISGISIMNRGEIKFREVNRLCFSILQCTATRITRTMYISCPTCGRTKFNLQEAVRKVREKTGHLKGLKIAVMGCIVNGPGEMAGADWGYVGAADGKVHIYKGTLPVLKNIPEENAADEMLRLIEEDLRPGG